MQEILKKKLELQNVLSSENEIVEDGELATELLSEGEMSQKVAAILDSEPNFKDDAFKGFSLLHFIPDREKYIETLPWGQQGPLFVVQNSSGHRDGAKVAYFRLRQTELLAQKYPEIDQYIDEKINQLLLFLTIGRNDREATERKLTDPSDRRSEKIAEFLELLEKMSAWLHLPNSQDNGHTDLQNALRLFLFYPITEKPDATFSEDLLRDFLQKILEFQGTAVQEQSLRKDYQIKTQRKEYFFDVVKNEEEYVEKTKGSNGFFYFKQIEELKKGIAQLQLEIHSDAKHFAEDQLRSMEEETKRKHRPFHLSLLYKIIDLLE